MNRIKVKQKDRRIFFEDKTLANNEFENIKVRKRFWVSNRHCLKQLPVEF